MFKTILKIFFSVLKYFIKKIINFTKHFNIVNFFYFIYIFIIINDFSFKNVFQLFYKNYLSQYI